MSFRAQEDVLFNLLYDRASREQFAKSPAAFLAASDLDEDERRDFAHIAPGALELDAAMRADFILTHFCRALPVTFALASSLPGGVERIRSLIDLQTMHAPPVERVLAFGSRLRALIAGMRLDPPKELQMILAVADAEIGMVYTSTALKKETLAIGDRAPEPMAPPPGAEKRPVRLAPFVCAAIVPLPYADLKQALCGADGGALWRLLGEAPVKAERRREVLRGESPRLLMARAKVTQLSPCEPAVDHVTIELAPGFAPLLKYLDGNRSIADLVAELAKAGAQDDMRRSVQERFLQLVELGMLAIE